MDERRSGRARRPPKCWEASSDGPSTIREKKKRKKTKNVERSVSPKTPLSLCRGRPDPPDGPREVKEITPPLALGLSHDMVWYDMVDVCDGCLAAEAHGTGQTAS